MTENLLIALVIQTMTALGSEPFSMRQIQDASFHGQILLPHSLLTEAAASEDYLIHLRTSNFGQLATAYDDDTMVRPDALSTIIGILEEQGYTYVPTVVLNEPYPDIRRFPTWGMRYFEWM